MKLLFGTVFLCMGLIILNIGIQDYRHETSLRNRLEVEGVHVAAIISDISVTRTGSGSNQNTQRRVSIAYVMNGREHRQTLNYWDSTMYVGKPMALLVDPANPNIYVSAAGTTSGGILTLILGPVFTLVGAGFFIAIFKQAMLSARLKRDGVVVYAQVVGSEQDWNVRINGRPLDVVVAEFDGAVYRSRGIIPASVRATIMTDSLVVVRYLEENPKKYIMYLKEQVPQGAQVGKLSF
jgi:hypothetical protein